MRIRYLSFMIAEHASTRVLDAVTTIILVQTLDLTSLGTFMVYQSWVALLLLLFPALENMLYREHGKHKEQKTLGRELAVYRKFNLMKLGLALVLATACSFVAVKDVDWSRRFAAMALAFALPLAQSLYGIYREPLRFELHQGTVVVINALQRAGVIAAIYLLGLMGHGAVEPVAFGAIAVYVVFGGVWAWQSGRHLGTLARASVSFNEAWTRIRGAVAEVVLWVHLTGALMAAVQTLDIYFLSRAGTPLGEIAVYSIALKAANFFQIIPLPFIQAFGVYLGRRSDRKDEAGERRLVWLGFLALGALGAIMCVVGFAFAMPILEFLGRGKFSYGELLRANEYFRWMLAGVAVLSLSFAHGTYLSGRGNTKGLVLYTMLPWFAFSALIYFVAAQAGGIDGTLAAAKANVAVAAFYALAQIGFFIWGNKRRLA